MNSCDNTANQQQRQQQQEDHNQQIEELNNNNNPTNLNNNNTNNNNNNNLVEMHMQHYQTHPTTPHVDPFGGNYIGGGSTTRAGLVFPDPTPSQQPIIPWNLGQVHPFASPNDPFNIFPSSSSSTSYAGLFTRRPSTTSLQFAYDGPSSDHLRLLSDALGPMVAQHGSAPFGLQAELNKMTAQEIMDAKALAASKSHSEAERRRRERINNHLAKLRSLLPSTTKTDKASLLAEVIQHVKELRRQTSAIAETSSVPTETDELSVDPASDDQDGKFIIKATFCCDDRTDLLPDLIKALKSLRLRTLKAEITTVGGRVKNVLFVTQEPNNNNNNNNDEQDDQEDDDGSQSQCSISSIYDALKAVMEKSNAGDESSSGNAKRQRTATINIS